MERPPLLTSARRRELRARAHSLRPVVMLGRQGLSESALAQVDRELASHELIKVRLAGERDERAETAQAMAERLGCEVVGQVGRIAILYRERPEEEPDDR